MKNIGKYVIIHRGLGQKEPEIECNEVTLDEIKRCLDLYEEGACGTMSFSIDHTDKLSVTRHNNYGFPVSGNGV